MARLSSWSPVARPTTPISVSANCNLDTWRAGTYEPLRSNAAGLRYSRGLHTTNSASAGVKGAGIPATNCRTTTVAMAVASVSSMALAAGKLQYGGGRWRNSRTLIVGSCGGGATMSRALVAAAATGAAEERASAAASAPTSAPDVASMKVSELSVALQALGLPRSGRKGELVARLLAAQAHTAATAGDGGGGGGDNGCTTPEVAASELLSRSAPPSSSAAPLAPRQRRRQQLQAAVQYPQKALAPAAATDADVTSAATAPGTDNGVRSKSHAGGRRGRTAASSAAASASASASQTLAPETSPRHSATGRREAEVGSGAASSQDLGSGGGSGGGGDSSLDDLFGSLALSLIVQERAPADSDKKTSGRGGAAAADAAVAYTASAAPAGGTFAKSRDREGAAAAAVTEPSRRRLRNPASAAAAAAGGAAEEADNGGSKATRSLAGRRARRAEAGGEGAAGTTTAGRAAVQGGVSAGEGGRRGRRGGGSTGTEEREQQEEEAVARLSALAVQQASTSAAAAAAVVEEGAVTSAPTLRRRAASRRKPRKEEEGGGGAASGVLEAATAAAASEGHVEPAPAPAATAAAAAVDAAAAADATADATADAAPPLPDDLPPWPHMYMGQPRRATDLAPGDPDAQLEVLLSNVPGLSLTALGTAAVQPTAGRALGCLALARGKDIFVFDAGDDSQRQLARAYHIKPSKVYRIFLTSMEPESVLGLPGLICSINSARERGHETADIPVHVYGPPGAAEFVDTMMRITQTYLEVTLVVHEFHPSASGPQPPPQLLSRTFRASTWALLLPPDQRNPEGGVDASLMGFAPEQGRSSRRKGRSAGGGVLSYDPRAGYLDWPPLPPGDPDRHDLPPEDLTWTLQLDISARVVVSMLPGGGSGGHTLAYTFVEADRAGALVVDRALAAGLREGPHFADLKRGQPAVNRDGTPIPPSLVISPTRPGRRVVVMGPTRQPACLTRPAHAHMRGADVLVAGPLWTQEDADVAAEAGGCTAAALGEAVRQLGVRYVMLSRFDTRRVDGGAGDGGGRDGWSYKERLAAEVRAAAAGTSAGSGSGTASKVVRKRSAKSEGRRGGADGDRSGVGSGSGGGEVGGRLRGVMVLRELESVLIDKNEGPEEQQD